MMLRKRLTPLVAAAVVAVAALALAGWAADAPVLAELGGADPMRLPSAAGLAAAGTAVLLAATGREGRVTAGLAGLCSLLGGAVLVERLGLAPDLTRLLYPAPEGAPVERAFPGTGLALLLLGVGLLLSQAVSGRLGRRAAVTVLVAAAALAGLSAIGRLYGASALYAAPAYSTAPPHTAVSVLALSLCGLLRLTPVSPWFADRGLRTIAAGVLLAVLGGAVLARLAGAGVLSPPLAIFLGMALAVADLLFALRENARGQSRRLAELQAMNLRLVQLGGDVADREARLRVALDAASMGDWRWDAATDRLTLSPGAAAIFGLPSELTTSWAEVQALVHSEDRERVQKDIRSALVSGANFEVEYRILRPSDGIEVSVLAAGRGVYDDGRPVGTVGVVTDVTQQRQAQESERLLAREIDHRARNVLAVVQAIVKLTPAENPREYRSSVSLRVNALARAHTMLAEARWTGVSLETLLRRELSPLAGDRLVLSGPPVELKPAAVQPFTLLLHEIAGHAARRGAFSGPGPVHVDWWTMRGGELALGWDEPAGGDGNAEHDRFASALVAGLVGQLGGRLEREPRDGGARTSICLPSDRFVVRRRAEAEAAAAAAPGPSTALDGVSVLVVEDEPLLALEMRDTLEAAGGVVLGPANSVGQAMELLAEHRPDFAVLDINLGGETSVPIAAELKRRSAPFVFVTGYQKPEVMTARVLQKPVAANDLLTVIGEELGRCAG